MKSDAYSELYRDIFYLYGPGVTKIGESAFKKMKRLRKAIFPKVTRIGSDAFAKDYALESFIAPLCSDIKRGVF